MSRINTVSMKPKLLLLIKVQLLSYFRINKALHSGASKLKLLGALALITAAAVSIALSFYGMFIGLAESLLYISAPIEVIPAAAVIMACMVVMFAGTLQSPGLLFRYRDYEITMSLPVSAATVAASRIAVLYLFEMVYTLLLMVPACVVYAQYASPPPMYYAAFLLLTPAVPLIPLIASCALGTLLTVVTSRMRRFSNAVGIVLTFALILAAMSLQFVVGGNPGETMSAMGEMVNQMSAHYPPALMFVRGVCEGDLLSFASFMLLSAGTFTAFCLILASRYRELYSRVSQNVPVPGAKTGGYKLQPPLYALYRRELSRLFSSIVYVTNTLTGLVLAIAGCCVLLTSGGFAGLPPEALAEGLDKMLQQSAPALLSMLVAMSATTGSSISLEGRKLWIIKSLPVSAREILLSKILVSLTFSIPASIICGTLLTLTLDLQGSEIVAVYLAPTVYAVYSAVFGLLLNLKLPKLDWQTEVQVVKQSAASMATIFGGMALPLLTFIGSMSMSHLRHFILLTLPVPVIATVLMAAYLSKNGDRLIAGLEQ